MPRDDAISQTDKLLWQQYDLYLSVVRHEHKRREVFLTYRKNCARYVLAHCVSEADRALIVTSDDYTALFKEAFCPELSEEDLSAVLADTFQGFLSRTAFAPSDVSTTILSRLLLADKALGIGGDTNQ